jgi:thiamine-monophosphate kinase
MNPADIAYRAVAVNLSDIAAMGGRPRWMTLALTLRDSSEQWVDKFSRGLFEAADQFDVALVGGDTTGGPVVVVTVAVTGEVPVSAALLRRGANAGDVIYVTGTLGDAAAGLELLRHGAADEFLVQRFLRPTPRLETGFALLGKASAAIDISDGLLGDVKKLLIASGVGAEIDIDVLPLSNALQSHLDIEQQRQSALFGGDDYELCFTADAESVSGIPGITAIGRITQTRNRVCFLNGGVVEMDDSGYRHFR